MQMNDLTLELNFIKHWYHWNEWREKRTPSGFRQVMWRKMTTFMNGVRSINPDCPTPFLVIQSTYIGDDAAQNCLIELSWSSPNVLIDIAIFMENDMVRLETRNFRISQYPDEALYFRLGDIPDKLRTLLTR